MTRYGRPGSDVSEIFGNGLGGDVTDRESLAKLIGPEMEPTKVRREVDDPAGSEVRRDEFEQFGMVSLHVPGLLALRRSGEGRRVGHDQIEGGLTPPRPMLEKGPGFVPHNHVPPGVTEAVGSEVPPGPVEVGVGEIETYSLHRTARRSVNGKAARVTEQVEHPLAGGLLPHKAASRPMVEKQAGVEVVGEIHLEGKAPLANRDGGGTVAQFFVLATPPLPAAGLEKGSPWKHAEFGSRGFDHPVQPDLVLDLGAVVGPVVFGHVQPAGIPVDRQRNLGDVFVVHPEGLDLLPAGPLGEMLEPLGEPAAEVACLGCEIAAAGNRHLGRRRYRLRSLAEFEFDEPAGNRPVGKRNPVSWFEAQLLEGRRIGGQDRRPPAAAPAHEPVAQPAVDRRRPRQRQPLAVGWVGDDQPWLPRRHDRLEMLLFHRDRLGQPGRLGAGAGGGDGPRIEVARQEQAGGRAHAGFERRDEPLGERAVAITKPEEAMPLPPGSPQSGSHARSDRGGLDHERARATHRIEQRLAGGE